MIKSESDLQRDPTDTHPYSIQSAIFGYEVSLSKEGADGLATDFTSYIKALPLVGKTFEEQKTWESKDPIDKELLTRGVFTAFERTYPVLLQLRRNGFLINAAHRVIALIRKEKPEPQNLLRLWIHKPID